MDDLLEFNCPRCDRMARARFWGVCEACREDLVAASIREARQVEVQAYEPKMNVVPNQVATKD